MLCALLLMLLNSILACLWTSNKHQQQQHRPNHSENTWQYSKMIYWKLHNIKCCIVKSDCVSISWSQHIKSTTIAYARLSNQWDTTRYFILIIYEFCNHMWSDGYIVVALFHRSARIAKESTKERAASVKDNINWMEWNNGTILKLSSHQSLVSTESVSLLRWRQMLLRFSQNYVDHIRLLAMRFQS